MFYGNSILATNSFKLISSAASVNATLVKALPGITYTATGYNTNAAARYLKFYDKATTPVVGTDIPVWTEYLAPQSKFMIPFGGLVFAKGIGLAVTVLPADVDATDVGAGDIMTLSVGYS